MTTDPPSSQWTPDEVLAQLRAKTGEGGQVAAQVFLHDDTANVSDVAASIVEAAKRRAGAKVAVTLGKVHHAAKSFSLRADVDTLAAVAKMPAVKSILPSEIADIFPRPTKVTPV